MEALRRNELVSLHTALRWVVILCVVAMAVVPAKAYADIIATTAPTGTYPTDIVFNPDRHRAYVATTGSGTVWVFNTDTYALIASIELGTGARALALDPLRGRLYVAGYHRQRIHVIDENTLEVVAEYVIGNSGYPYSAFPTFLALDIAGQRLFVTHDVPAGTISVLDAMTGTLLNQVITNAGSAVGLAFDPSRGVAYASTYNRTLHAIDTETQSLVWQVAEAGAGYVKYDARSRDVYVATNNFVEASHAVSRVSPDTRTVTARAEAPHVGGFDVGGPKHRVYAAGYWTDAMHIFNASLTATIASVPVCCHSSIAGVDPNSGLIWYADEFGNIYIVRDDYGNTAPVAASTTTAIMEDTPAVVTLSASDLDGDTLGYAVVSGPTYGTATLSGETVLYTPLANYAGPDSFTFVARDGIEDSEVATVRIEVQAVNDAPQVSAGGPYSGVVGSGVTLSAVVTDVEDASPAVSWDLDGDGSYETIGTLVTYTPTNTGTHNVPVRVTDSGGLVVATTAVVSARYNVCLAYQPGHVVRSGATVPLRVRLCDANGVNLSSPAIVLSARAVVRTSAFITGAVEDAGHANPDADFRYDAAFGGYIFNFQTRGLSTGSWSVQFVAGSEAFLYSAPFQIK